MPVAREALERIYSDAQSAFLSEAPTVRKCTTSRARSGLRARRTGQRGERELAEERLLSDVVRLAREAEPFRRHVEPEEPSKATELDDEALLRKAAHVCRHRAHLGPWDLALQEEVIRRSVGAGWFLAAPEYSHARLPRAVEAIIGNDRVARLVALLWTGLVEGGALAVAGDAESLSTAIGRTRATWWRAVADAVEARLITVLPTWRPSPGGRAGRVEDGINVYLLGPAALDLLGKVGPQAEDRRAGAWSLLRGRPARRRARIFPDFAAWREESEAGPLARPERDRSGRDAARARRLMGGDLAALEVDPEWPAPHADRLAEAVEEVAQAEIQDALFGVAASDSSLRSEKTQRGSLSASNPANPAGQRASAGCRRTPMERLQGGSTAPAGAAARPLAPARGDEWLDEPTVAEAGLARARRAGEAAECSPAALRSPRSLTEAPSSAAEASGAAEVAKRSPAAKSTSFPAGATPAAKSSPVAGRADGADGFAGFLAELDWPDRRAERLAFLRTMVRVGAMSRDRAHAEWLADYPGSEELP